MAPSSSNILPDIPLLGRLENVQWRWRSPRTNEHWFLGILVSGRIMRGGAPGSNLRLMLRGERSFMRLAGNPLVVPAPILGAARLTGMTREDGSYEVLVDQPGKFSVSVETLDGHVRFPPREVEIPDAASYMLDMSLAPVQVAGSVVDKETDQSLPNATVFRTEGVPSSAGTEAFLRAGAGTTAKTR
jgi:hypothetical protein